ncbi:MAG: translation initiation factor IF-2 [Roseburia sp.]|nr:translation initiation factor IF-2 [Roseburia sp.]
MAKMRVHELAKELDINSKEIIDALSTTEYAVKSHSSSVDDAAQEIIRKKFHKGGSKKEEVKAAPVAEKKEEKAVEEKNGDRPKKKSSITAVFNPQNSKNGTTRRPGQQRNSDRTQGARPQNDGNRQKSDATGAAKEGTRPQNQGTRPQTDRRPQGDRPQTDRNNGDRPQYNRNNGDRPQGDRPQYNRNNGDRPQYNRNNGDRPQYNRNNGDRPQGDRPQYNRNNGNRPQGDRPYADRNGRPSGNGQRGNYQGQRPNGGGYGQGGRGGDNRNGNYRGNNGGGRLDREIDRFKKDAAPAEELRGKESRDRMNDKNRNNKRNDHDALGKKQERYVNLEKNGGKKKPQQPQPKQEEDVIKTLTLPEKLTIRELADKMKVQPSVIVKKLFLKGTMVTVNQEVDYDTAEEIALEFNCICEPEEKIDVIAELLKEDEEAEETLVPRPPVVCVMGHVDHGKTSLLDAIRSTRVTDREAGGITQHIGASVVSINNQNITFLDTPGHEAFTAMRMRGANSTDIAILVVAADDGVMPQTIEAINHAKAAGVEIIVAVNKIDKPSANIERVKQELSEYELIPEDWGGSTIFCPVSARTHEGIENLLEMILLTAEVLELKANPKRNARGLVIEAQLDKGRGAVATVLVQKGTLHVGDPIACGSSFGKVRAMIDDKGCRVKEAGPSTPVEILGLSNVPDAGETFVCCDSEKEARAFAETYISEGKNKLIEDTKAKMSLDDLFSQIQSGNVKELNIIVKADVQGSVEAVKQSLVKLSNEEVVVKVIHGGVGAINESDVILASASNAIIIGFNVRPDPTAKVTAERENVDVRLYKVIYSAIEDVAAAMKGMLDPVYEEKVIGHAEIRQIFKASGIGNIAGSYVLDGAFQRGCKVRITREGEQIFEGDLASLKRFKDDVKEVKAGYECGLVFDGFNDIQELDQVESYIMVEVPR